MVSLRPYQYKAVENIKSAFANKIKRVILRLDTGAGKTIIFCWISELVYQKQKSVLIITNRTELIDQSHNTLVEKFNIIPAILNRNTKKIPENAICVAMVQTLVSRLKTNPSEYKTFFNSFSLVIADEAHRGEFDALLKHFNAETQYLIGATATPLRTGKMTPLSVFYDTIISSIKISELINEKFLVPARYFGIEQDLSKIKISKGDYDTTQLNNFYKNKAKYESVLSEYIRIANGKKFICYCSGVEVSKELCNFFNENGIESKHIDANMESEREEIFNGFRESKFTGLFNVGIATTGFDCPDVECIILDVATKSLVLYLQMVGRGGRPSKNKNFFYVLDFGNNIEEHGYWHIDREWSLDIKKKSKSKEKENVSPVKYCPNCNCIIPVSAKKCEYCQYTYPLPEKKKIEMRLIEYKDYDRAIEESDFDVSIVYLCAQMQFGTYENLINNYVIDKLKHDRKKLYEYAKMRGYKNGWVFHRLNNIKKR